MWHHCGSVFGGKVASKAVWHKKSVYEEATWRCKVASKAVEVFVFGKTNNQPWRCIMWEKVKWGGSWVLPLLSGSFFSLNTLIPEVFWGHTGYSMQKFPLFIYLIMPMPMPCSINKQWAYATPHHFPKFQMFLKVNSTFQKGHFTRCT